MPRSAPPSAEGESEPAALRVGFLGSGFMGQMAHLANYHELPGCRVVALAEARPRRAEAVASRYGIPTVYDSHEQLLADRDVQAVICAQPFHRNYPLGREIFRAGKHLFTEKPMAGSLADARELVALAEQRGLVYAVGFMKRHDPGIQLAQQTLAALRTERTLGTLRMVDTTCFLGDWLQNPGRPITTDEPPPTDDLAPRYPAFLRETWREAYDHFLNIYSHNVNLLHFLLPGRRLVCESAHAQDRAFLVSLRSDETLISLRGVPSRSHRWEERTKLHWDNGRMVIESPTPMNRQAVAQVDLWREADGRWTRQRLFPVIEWAFARQARAFVEAVRDGGRLVSSGVESLADVALMEAIFSKLQEN